MKASIAGKLEKLAERFDEVNALLADSEVIGDTNRFRDLSVEYARLDPVVTRFRDYGRMVGERETAQALADGDDPELRELGQEELTTLSSRIDTEAAELAKLLIPKDPRD